MDLKLLKYFAIFFASFYLHVFLVWFLFLLSSILFFVKQISKR